ncbi:Glu/Leu/Phe/Val dehydrogenase [Candidatus Pacearchaeota archaeon]|nr:MAG: Glu/Leu/Phe/Val dehydrogenase [Candidatus Pacearchaeota archaeon]
MRPQKVYNFDTPFLFGSIVVDSTTLGNPLGGTRMMEYPGPREAEEDARRLARGMTYKFGETSLPFGGAKAAICPKTEDKNAVLREYARILTEFNEGLSRERGRYFITGEDIGIGVPEVDFLQNHTNPDYLIGSSKGSGDPSPFTAEGVFNALKVCCLWKYGVKSPKEKTVLLQGIGKVGSSLLKLLAEEGAKVIAADKNPKSLERAREKFSGYDNVSFLEPEEADTLFERKADILVPCAIGGTITEEAVRKTGAKIVCGAANNQLENLEVADFMHRNGTIYAPDYIANSAGAIRVGVEVLSRGRDFNKELFEIEFNQIPLRVNETLYLSRKEMKNPARVSIERVDRKLSLLNQL